MSKDAVLDVIVEHAKKDKNIRAIILNGSRVNPNAKKDAYQDYDVKLFVKSVQAAYDNVSFLETFGDVIIRQTHEDMTFDPPETLEPIVMTQYKSGLRIDLSFAPIDALKNSIKRDSLSTILLDKEQLVTSKLPPDESSYYIKKPSQKVFLSCINEFLWVMPYVKKGVNRKQYKYAIEHIAILRNCLEAMMDWSVGAKYDFNVSTGKAKMYYPKYLDHSLYTSYLSTFPKADVSDILCSLETLYALFEQYTRIVSKALGYTYYPQEFKRVKSFTNTY